MLLSGIRAERDEDLPCALELGVRGVAVAEFAQRAPGRHPGPGAFVGGADCPPRVRRRPRGAKRPRRVARSELHSRLRCGDSGGEHRGRRAPARLPELVDRMTSRVDVACGNLDLHDRRQQEPAGNRVGTPGAPQDLVLSALRPPDSEVEQREPRLRLPARFSGSPVRLLGEVVGAAQPPELGELVGRAPDGPVVAGAEARQRQLRRGRRLRPCALDQQQHGLERMSLPAVGDQVGLIAAPAIKHARPFRGALQVERQAGVGDCGAGDDARRHRPDVTGRDRSHRAVVARECLRDVAELDQRLAEGEQGGRGEFTLAVALRYREHNLEPSRRFGRIPTQVHRDGRCQPYEPGQHTRLRHRVHEPHRACRPYDGARVVTGVDQVEGQPTRGARAPNVSSPARCAPYARDNASTHTGGSPRSSATVENRSRSDAASPTVASTRARSVAPLRPRDLRRVR